MHSPKHPSIHRSILQYFTVQTQFHLQALKTLEFDRLEVGEGVTLAVGYWYWQYIPGVYI